MAHQPVKGNQGGEAYRGSASKRGYDRTWQRFRAAFLADPENIICADCKRKPSTEAHHKKKVIDFPELRLVWSNLLGLCHDCHAKRTGRGE